MPRSGGIYSLPAGSIVVNGTTIDAAQHNTPLNDIASDLNAVRPISSGGTGAGSAGAARTALGLEIGTNVQAQNANLSSLAGLTLAANKGFYSTAANTAALYDLTPFARTLLDDADAVTARATLALEAGAITPVSVNPDFTVAGTSLADRATIKTFVDATDLTFRNANDLGWGQTWQNVSGLRSASTSYQNLTGKPIYINVRQGTAAGANDYSLEVSPNNSTWVVAASARSDSGAASPMAAIVPADWYYRAILSENLVFWAELR